MLIEPQELQLKLESGSDLLMVDLGHPDRYQKAHIPGAVHVSPAQTQSPPPFPGYLPSLEALTQLMASIGYHESKTIIVYDDEGGGWAGRFIWMLDSIGHTRYEYLNGGLVAWHGEGYPLEQGQVQITPTKPALAISTEPTINRIELEQLLDSNQIDIWDARSPAEHTGAQVHARRGGHIPGAKNIDWIDLMDRNRHLKLLPLPVIREKLNEQNITGDKLLVTHCQSHHRSGLTYLVAKLLGFEAVKAYAGSWGEWGNLPDTPIELD